MDVVYRCCAGIDVHKKMVMVCVLRWHASGKREKEVRKYATMTGDLLALSDWLGSLGVTHVAMESTGVYWKPIYNILEERFEVLLCNARHVKNVPGRKTDVRDCEWLAQLLQHGLLEPSFIPPRAQRDLRDLTRHRTQLVGEKTRVANRIQKVLEDANVKLASVASDPLGVSGRDMIRALIAGETEPGRLAELARRKLRGKIPELRRAMMGRVTEHHRYLLGTLMGHLAFLEAQIAQLEARIEALVNSPALSPDPGPHAPGPHKPDRAPTQNPPDEIPDPYTFRQAVSHISTVDGMEERSAQAVLAEIGTDMSRFHSDKHLCSWSRICPGNNESAGKRKHGKTGKANRWLRSTLVQCAWAASRTKGTYLAAQYKRIASRRGKKRAILAVAHSLLKIIYHMLKYHAAYRDLGGDYFDKINPDGIKRYHVKRLERLGFKVALEPLETAA
jgi:transposase